MLGLRRRSQANSNKAGTTTLTCSWLRVVFSPPLGVDPECPQQACTIDICARPLNRSVLSEPRIRNTATRGSRTRLRSEQARLLPDDRASSVSFHDIGVGPAHRVNHFARYVGDHYAPGADVFIDRAGQCVAMAMRFPMYGKITARERLPEGIKAHLLIVFEG